MTATAEASQQGAQEAVPPPRWLWVTGYTAAAVLWANREIAPGLGSYAEGNSAMLDSHGAILLAARRGSRTGARKRSRGRR